MSVNRRNVIVVGLALTTAAMACPVMAADMTYGERPVIVREPRPVVTTVRTTYVRQSSLECSDMWVSYRPPLYEPYTEIVRVCHRPR